MTKMNSPSAAQCEKFIDEVVGDLGSRPWHSFVKNVGLSHVACLTRFGFFRIILPDPQRRRVSTNARKTLFILV